MGAVCFYLYTRIKQTEKKLALVEGILLDLKTATEASFLDFPAATSYMITKDVGDDGFNPLDDTESTGNEEQEDDTDEMDNFPFESEETNPGNTINVTKTDTIVSAEPTIPATESVKESPDIDLELMNVKELIAVARSKGLTVSKTMRKQQIIDAINAATATATAATADEQLEEVSPDGFANESSLLTGSTLGSAPF